MAIHISSINPAVQKIFLFVCLVMIISFFTSVLVEVGSTGKQHSCASETDHKNISSCWDWRINNVTQTLKCPFTLLFSSLLCFGISFICFFISGLAKCLFPEIVFATYRTTGFCRKFSQYYIFVLHVIGSLFVASFLVILLIFSHTKDSCFYGADIIKLCTHHHKYCWMIVLLCFGFLVCLFATVISVFETRKFYVERLDMFYSTDDEYQERLYCSSDYAERLLARK